MPCKHLQCSFLYSKHKLHSLNNINDLYGILKKCIDESGQLPEHNDEHLALVVAGAPEWNVLDKPTWLLFFPCNNWKASPFQIDILKGNSALVTQDSFIAFKFFAILIYTRKYGRLCQPIFSPFGYERVQELFRMTNIWNGNNSERMTLIRKEWQ